MGFYYWDTEEQLHRFNIISGGNWAMIEPMLCSYTLFDVSMLQTFPALQDLPSELLNVIVCLCED